MNNIKRNDLNFGFKSEEEIHNISGGNCLVHLLRSQ